MKKRSREEILLKLGQADELARAGKSQVDICKALGVSVMTLHRWRKLSMIIKAKAECPAVLAEQTPTPVPLLERMKMEESAALAQEQLP